MTSIVIIGQGAMGLLWYHKLNSTGVNIAFLSDKKANKNSDGNTDNNTMTNGYSFTDINNATTQGIFNTIDKRQLMTVDTILVCVKSYQVSDALIDISSQLKAKTSIILAHNGMGTLRELPQSLTSKHCLLALITTHGCLRTAPFNITHTGYGSSDIGVVAGELTQPQQKALTAVLSKALPPVKFHQNIVEKQWRKLAINCVINPLTALHDINNGEINAKAQQTMIKKILAEVVEVAHCEKIELTFSELQGKVTQVAKDTAKNSSSMRCDLLAKRKTEIDYINGYIHHLGIKHHIATPENTALWYKITQRSGY